MLSLLQTAFLAKLLPLLKKEWRELVRDKRSLSIIFLVVFISPVILYFSLKFITEQQNSTKDIPIAVQVSDEVPDHIGRHLKQFIVQKGLTLKGDFAGTPDDFDSEQVFGVLVLSQHPRTQHYQLTWYENDAKQSSMGPLRKIKAVLSHYLQARAQIATMKQGVSLSGPQWQLDIHQVNTQSGVSVYLINAILILPALAAIAYVSMNYVNDATAGERDRGGLKPLLCQPISQLQIVSAKWLTAAALAFIGAGISMVLCMSVISQFPLHRLGINFSLTPSYLLFGLISILPLALLVPAVQICVALFAKNFKEGQSYLAMVTIIPVGAAYVPQSMVESAFYLPFFGQRLFINALFTGQELPWMAITSATLVTLVLAVAGVLFTAQQLKKESIACH